MSVFIGYPSFMAYQMMKGKKDNNKGFPSIPGTIARYSALGLTNEQMEENPVWKDLTGNGHDLQMKNFLWAGMSGVGGYVTNKEVYEYDLNKYSYVFIPSERKVHDFYVVFELTGYDESFEDGFNLDVRSITQGLKKRVTYTKNGIYTFQYKDEEGLDNLLLVGYNGNGGERSTFTVKFLPLYLGALVFDGVDDYGVCENFPILNKEKGYTVVALRQWITYNPNAISAIATNASDQSFNGAFTFENYNKGAEQTISYGATQISLQYSKSPFSWQTTSKYNGVNIANGNKDATNSLVLGRSYPQRNDFANFAIWELVFLDHDATEEELTKIKDYFVKTYPWLFPDQAWTVTGKTNEDEDRATIANITGNGNNLVLSNFGFAEGSGYGLYYQYFGNEFKATNGEIEGGGWNIIDNYNISHDKRIPINSIGKCFWDNKALVNGIKLRFKLTGMTEGDVLAFGYAATYNLTYTSDGIYAIDLPPADKPYGFSLQSSLTENLPTTPVTIELLPFEYEGYLVTDGVDDSGRAANLTISKDFTMVGEWVLFSETSENAGISIHPHIHIFNRPDAIQIMFRGAGKTLPVKSLKAICSDGRCYDENWSELKINVGKFTDSRGTFYVANNGTFFSQTAFKNLGIYNDQLFSKDDCIKAYNYLQTLKAK